MTRFLSTLAAVLACLVLPVAAVSTWIDLKVTSTSGYVAAVAPLSDNRDIQHAATTSIDASVLDAAHLSSSDTAGDAVDSAVSSIVRSDTFARAWKDGNRQAHREVIDILAGDDSSLVEDDGSVRVDLGDLLDPIVAKLGGGDIPTDGLADAGLSVDVVDASTLAHARTAYHVVDVLGFYPAIAWVVLLLLALVLPGARRRAVTVLGVGTLLAVGLTAVALLAGRAYLRAKVPGDVAAVATAVVDAVARSLWIGLAVLAVVAVVALLARATVGRRPHARA